MNSNFEFQLSDNTPQEPTHPKPIRLNANVGITNVGTTNAAHLVGHVHENGTWFL